jgi:cytochrome P450
MKAVLATLFSRVRLARPPGSRSAPVRRGVSLAPDDGAVMVVEGHLENVLSNSTGG